MSWLRPKNEPDNTRSGRLEQYQNRLDLATKVGGTTSAVLLVAALAIAATDFSKDAPGWLRASALILCLLGALCIGRAWVGFNWKAIQLRRQPETADVGEWPKSYEFFWTLGLYLLLLDVIALVATTVWSMG